MTSSQPSKKAKMTEEEQFKQVEEYAKIIKFQHEDGPAAKDKYTARTIPNQRLHTVFGIGSSFTNPDPLIHNKVVQEAIKVMQKATDDDDDWSTLTTHAIDYCRDYLQHPSNATGVNLAGLVQFLTLKLSLDYLFPGETSLEAKDFADIVFIGKRISQLWIESKKGEGQIPEWQHETELQDALRRVFKQGPKDLAKNDMARLTAWQLLASISAMFVGMHSLLRTFRAYKGISSWMRNKLGKPKETIAVPSRDPRVPRQNPMNLILPAYETMWRVVMRCFIEIRYRGAPKGPKWSETMTLYSAMLQCFPLYEPDERLWNTSLSSVMAMDIVKEALRLYPPTRRVHRSINGKILVADIEKCQRFEILAGDDPLVFAPERWHKNFPEERVGVDRYDQAARKKLKQEEERRGFMPFAFHCPSSMGTTKAFGFKMIGLLVGVLCDTVPGDWVLESEEDLPELGEPLKSDREACGDLRLIRPVEGNVEAEI